VTHVFKQVTDVTQEPEVRRVEVQSHPGQIVRETLSQKPQHEKRLAEWLKW
jgi:hypothetical protein